MATLLQRPQSILLNPSPSASPTTFPLSLPSSSPSIPPAALSAASSSSYSNDQDKVPKMPITSSSFPENPRRIRFAPLPVPDPAFDFRVPASESMSSDLPPVLASPFDSLSPIIESDPLREEQLQTPSIPEMIPSLDYSQSFLSSPKKQSSSLSRRLFRPLISWTKSRSAPSSNADNDSLYQLSSRESTLSAGGKLRSNSKYVDDFGSPLSLWSSTGSVTSYASDSGHRLSRRPKQFASSLSSSLSRKPSITPPQKHPSAKPGIRMLNGRIYGRRRPYAQSSTDPFANVRSQEPEFVEWGYGGMGSNKVNEHSGVNGKWKIVQGDGKTSAFGNRSTLGDDDDASGMAWVRKRRQERENLRKEKEELDKRLAEVGDSVQSDSEAPPGEDNDLLIAEEQRTEGRRTPTSQLPSPTASSHRPDAPEHKHTAISVPPSAHKHHHHASAHKRDLASFRSPIIQTADNETPGGLGLVDVLGIDLAEIISSDAEVGEIIDPPVHTSPREDSSDSASEDGDSSPADDDDDDSDSDTESEDEEANRKTALGAGVEIVSRHKEHQEMRVPSTTANMEMALTGSIDSE